MTLHEPPARETLARESLAPEGSAHDALADVVNALSRLLRGEIALARAEMGESLRAARSALVQLVMAALFAMAGLVMLAEAAASWLMALGLSRAFSLLVVGLALVVLSAAFGQSGQSYLRDAGRLPRRSAENLKRDIETLQTMGDTDAR